MRRFKPPRQKNRGKFKKPVAKKQRQIKKPRQTKLREIKKRAKLFCPTSFATLPSLQKYMIKVEIGQNEIIVI